MHIPKIVLRFVIKSLFLPNNKTDFDSMSKVLEGLKYSESHEWVKVEGNIAVIGVSDFAQAEMGDITYVDMPEVDDTVDAGEEFGALESVKASSELISPVSGTVVEVNAELEDAPEKVNEDAYAAWIIKVEMSDPAQLDALLDAAAYKAQIGE
jgi:glycine cleavage system H protein